MSAPALPRGVASGLGAAVLFGVSTPFAKLLLPFSGPFMLAGLLYLGAGIGLTVIAPFRRADGEAPLLLNLEAPFTIGIAVLLFGESLARLEGIGAAAVVLGGVVLASGPSEGSMHSLGALAVGGAGLVRARHGHRHVHEAVEHDHAHDHPHQPDPHHRHRH